MESQEKKVRAEYSELAGKLADSSILATREGQDMARRQAELQKILGAFDTYKVVKKQHDEAESLLDDETDLGEIARQEHAELSSKLRALEAELKQLLTPPDPQAAKDAIVEIRAGAGGDEAALFAGDLFRMYSRYAERQGWKSELLSDSPTGTGGFKEVIFKINGPGAYGQLRFESGVHRVQRVPATESAGRVHTSTATVAVLPQAEEQDVELDAKDLRIDVFRSSGPGGQSVNTTDSAVRITHLPTGLVVTCQDEKSQLKNKAKAMGILRSRLLAAQLEKEAKERSEQRKSQIGSGDRSEKIRTYNFPQDRLTDHRIKLNLHNLNGILDGDISELVAKLHEAAHVN